MYREEIVVKLEEIFKEIFCDDSIVITDQMTANDVDAWDSITYIDMIALVEDEFNIRMATREIITLKNVGELITIIEKKANN